MKTLYFRGKQYPTRRLANKVVEVVAGFGIGSRMHKVHLIEEDLQILALLKYTCCIVRNHPDTLSPRVRSFLEAIVPGAAVMPVSDFSAMHNPTVSTRRIPHVLMVKASNLRPGMSIPRWLIDPPRFANGDKEVFVRVVRVAEANGKLHVMGEYRMGHPYDGKMVPCSFWFGPGQRVPVMAGWRERTS